MPNYPDHVPATIAELRELLRAGGPARCDGLIDELMGEPTLIGQLVTVSGHPYRIGGIPETPIRWLDPRPDSPALAYWYPHYGPPH